MHTPGKSEAVIGGVFLRFANARERRNTDMYVWSVPCPLWLACLLMRDPASVVSRKTTDRRGRMLKKEAHAVYSPLAVWPLTSRWARRVNSQHWSLISASASALHRGRYHRGPTSTWTRRCISDIFFRLWRVYLIIWFPICDLLRDIRVCTAHLLTLGTGNHPPEY